MKFAFQFYRRVSGKITRINHQDTKTPSFLRFLGVFVSWWFKKGLGRKRLLKGQRAELHPALSDSSGIG